jgi:hypothetical protein
MKNPKAYENSYKERKMKKNVIVAVLAVCMAVQVSAFDLLYGLDTSMTKEQVIAKAKEVFRVTAPVTESNEDISRDLSNDVNLRSLSWNRESKYPDNITVVKLVGLFPLQRTTSLRYLSITIPEFGTMPNISLYFSNGSLFAVTELFEFGSNNPERLRDLTALEIGAPTYSARAAAGYPNPATLFCFEKPESITYVIGVNRRTINRALLKK